MRLCYQVATPDVVIDDSVTAYQGSIEETFSALSELGYQGVEFMTRNPKELNWEDIRQKALYHGLKVVLVCTGEIYGQLGLTYTDPKAEVRKEAIERTKEIIDFAAYLGANINIGRIRGGYTAELTKEETERYAIEAFREISDYAKPKDVKIALESVTIMQTNFINTLEEALDMVKRVDRDNFRLMMDVFHLNIEEKDVVEAIKKYSPYNIHVHLADNNRRYPGNCGLDFETILETFYHCGYDGAFCTEIFQLPSMYEAAKGSVKHLKPILNKIYGA